MKTEKGYGQNDRYFIGDTTIRTRNRYGKITKRRYIKTGNGNQWKLYSKYLWEQKYGKIPIGLGVHHIDGNPLNDTISNLALISKAQHLAIHRPEFSAKALAAFITTRRKIRWSTKKRK
uniref:Putative homing endonuclease n=1 Tax=viral metagenome TaxID=1070528 RepID=A0A6M3KH51_9ZZZZ